MKRYQIVISNLEGTEGNSGFFSAPSEEEALAAAQAKWGEDWEKYPDHSIFAL
jgi:hypothetical protein